jgi:nicotinate-nucleotide adenylyltransferase
MSGSRRLGLLGGTFDPVHYGHLDAGDAARAALGLDEVRLLPSHDPPHRPIDPHATAFHRFALIALAIDGRRGYTSSDAELRREGPSYTIDTLHALRGDGWEPSQIFFIIGADAFAEIATWHRYPDVVEAANFVVIARPGTALEAALARVPELRRRTARPQDIGSVAGTKIVPIEARTRDVSSTAIRTRLAARQTIEDLVPLPVARHILAHHLYGAVDELHGQNTRRDSQSV